ncbi:MAG: phosphoglycerate mutase, partial [Ottowia sp.]|nr:phosphoglycerate mutase [Ottowia sp.]
MPAPTASEPLRHLLVPDAAPLPGVSADLPPLPNLAALLARLRVEHTLAPGADSPASPHELAAARANGLHGEPGRIPWAAFESGTVGTPCAWLRPVHLQLGMDAIQLLPPEALQLDDPASQALLA